MVFFCKQLEDAFEAAQQKPETPEQAAAIAAWKNESCREQQKAQELDWIRSAQEEAARNVKLQKGFLKSLIARHAIARVNLEQRLAEHEDKDFLPKTRQEGIAERLEAQALGHAEEKAAKEKVIEDALAMQVEADDKVKGWEFNWACYDRVEAEGSTTASETSDGELSDSDSDSWVLLSDS